MESLFVEVDVHAFGYLIKGGVAVDEYVMEVFGFDVRRHFFVSVGFAHALDPLFVLLLEFGSFRPKLFFDVFIAEDRF